MVIRDIELKKLRLLDNNPRKISADQMNKLCDSLINDPQFLKARPIMVNSRDGVLTVYAGNQRVRAAKKLKWKTIPCDVQENLSDELMKQRIIKDNKTYGEFDFDMLANEWEEELLIECGFNLSELGFGSVEEVDETEEKKPKKKKSCPYCGEQI